MGLYFRAEGPGPARLTSMAMDLNCPNCRATYHASPEHIGKAIRCSVCGAIVPITAFPQPLEVEPVTRPTVPSGRHTQTGPSHVIRTHKAGRWWSGLIVGGALAGALIVLAGLAWFRSGPDLPEVVSTQPSAASASGTEVRPEAPTAAPEESLDLVPETPHRAKRATEGVQVDRPPEHYTSLATGAQLEEDSGTEGHGELTIVNGTQTDAVVRLYDAYTAQTLRFRFVKSQEPLLLTGIPPGEYDLAFTTGLDWDKENLTFRWGPSYQQFERAVVYGEEREGREIRFNTVRVTLHPVLHGNARTKRISREQFLRGHNASGWR